MIRMAHHVRVCSFRKITAVLVACCILSGCSIAPVQNIGQQDKMLAPDEGILITKIRTNVQNTSILIHGKEGGSPLAYFSPIIPPEDLRVIRIRSGEAYFSKLSLDKSFVWRAPDFFKIEPGTINYVGDLVVQWEAEKEGISIHAYSLIVDRENETIAEAKRDYTWLFEKYPYRRAIK